jgi:hypothetical protein
MASRFPKSSRRVAEDRQARRLFVFSGLAIAAIVATLFVSREPPRDPVTGCPTSEASRAHTVVIVDQSDRYTDRQIQYAQVVILSEYNRLQLGDRLTVLGLSADPDHAERTFSKCRLRRGDDVIGFTTNPADVQRQFERTVGGDLADYIEALRTVAPAQASPIAETVAAISEAPDFSPGPTERRLVLISDMAQFSAAASQYGGGGLDLGRYASMMRDLDRVNVRIHYVDRNTEPLESIQSTAHKAFWSRYFEEQGAHAQLGLGAEPHRCARAARLLGARYCVGPITASA